MGLFRDHFWMMACGTIAVLAASKTALAQTPLPGDSPIAALLTPLPPAADATAAAPAEPASGVLSTGPPGAEYPWVWGTAGIRGIYAGERMAPNGVLFEPVFSLDLSLNLWLWRYVGLYSFADMRFWGQEPGLGVTNPDQKVDFSKREFDLNLGGAWNYYGPWEARFYAYSLNNLNRGYSYANPAGYNDGVALENRVYLSAAYSQLGTPAFDVARANYIGVGYMPTKTLVGSDGAEFKPSMFARAYLTCDLWPDICYVYGEGLFIAQRPIAPKLLTTDVGVAVRPFSSQWRWEFRAGCENVWDMQLQNARPLGYISARFVY
jgi:hypothetical protein